jgi:Zn-dependent protease
MRLVIYLPLLLLAFSAHEAAHAWAALQRGDPTARDQGRVTLLPFVHLDLWGSVLLPGLLIAMPVPWIFGYAKPTPVDPGKLRNPKRDFSLVALAGPGGNLALALVFAALGAVAFRWFGVDSPEARLLVGAGILTNSALACINLLPLPGLDGMKALYAFMSDEWCWRLQKVDRMFLPLIVAAALLGLLGEVQVLAFGLGTGLCALAGTGQPPL